MAYQEARLGQLRRELREAVLLRLEAADRAPELLALLDVGERVVERALPQPERLRGENHALLVQAGHQLQPAVPVLAEQVLGGTRTLSR